MMFEFAFWSDTNTQLFINWMIDHDKHFTLDSDTRNVMVPMHDMDENVWHQLRDLGGSRVD
jgi:hypothetical protein